LIPPQRQECHSALVVLAALLAPPACTLLLWYAWSVRPGRLIFPSGRLGLPAGAGFVSGVVVASLAPSRRWGLGLGALIAAGVLSALAVGELLLLLGALAAGHGVPYAVGVVPGLLFLVGFVVFAIAGLALVPRSLSLGVRLIPAALALGLMALLYPLFWIP
jgi:hypothetical protein